MGVPEAGTYCKILDSDDPVFGGSGYSTQVAVTTQAAGWHDFPARIPMDLPPLAVVVWRKES
jgi:1,4-alpha-glucan branching enzyme